MNSRQLPGCCAVNVIYGFDDLYADDYESVIDAVKAYDENPPSFLATTIPEQRAAIADLKKNKFVPLGTVRSHQGNYRVTIWGRGVTKPRAAAKKRAVRKAA
jgi:hypothetical protein